MAFDGIAPRPRATKTARGYSIRTGHPPVLDQIASQVRSSSGMTFGRARPGGGPALMGTAFVSSRLTERTAARLEATVAADAVIEANGLAARLLAYLQALDETAAELPERTILYERFGRGLIRALTTLQNQGKLRLWYATRHDGGPHKAEMIIRLTGREHELRTAAAPSYMHV